MLIGTYSRPISQLPGLPVLLGSPIVHLRPGQSPRNAGVTAIAGWGLRATTHKPRRIAQRENLPFIALEDGFLRSFGTGPKFPPLSIVMDHIGIYYAADRPSTLENLLESDIDLLSGPGACHVQAYEKLLSLGLSKYNASPDLESLPGSGSRRRVLVIDQTVGDASISQGYATTETFKEMLNVARKENPDAIIYVKTHPEVSGGAKKGYLSDIAVDERTILLRAPVSPASLLKEIDHVYVVTSHMGFEALLRGIKVSCFGMPWYAGWGLTDDQLSCERRLRHRRLEELFAAAYLHYTRYLNPETLQLGTIFDVMNWLDLQRRVQARMNGRTIGIGFRRWKAENVQPFLNPDPRRVHFVHNASAAAALAPNQADRLVIWGSSPHADITALAQKTGAELLRMEDGFVRSVGLGSDFIPPNALVLDRRGIYFDGRQTNDLEILLNTHMFTQGDAERAQHVRELITKNSLTKYNIEPSVSPKWRNTDRYVVLVPGQVEDDASIKYGCGEICTNLALLKAARKAAPDAFIVYKPHPDVLVRNRRGKVHERDALQFANHVETTVSIVSCIEAANELHTMTSLSGFDALLRGVRVVTYGKPFYAGWGLTTDRMVIPRRARQLSLDELVAGVLLHYPTYWDWTLRGFTSCEAVLHRTIQRRKELIESDGLEKLRKGYFQRQFHKIFLWLKAGFLVTR